MKPHALITGASRGIGRAIAIALAKADHPVFINYNRSKEKAEAVKAEIEADGGTAELLQFDVANASQVKDALGPLLESDTFIGVVVNNAGVTRDNPFPAIGLEDWQLVTRTTLDGFYNVTHPLVMKMVRKRWGRIVNISSVSGVMGNRGQTNYSAAKAGLIGATRSLSKELAKRKITVNAVAPGLIETDMIKDAPIEDIMKMVPMRRLGRPEEVAGLVRYLVSEEAAYITGQTIGINGGLA